MVIVLGFGQKSSYAKFHRDAGFARHTPPAYLPLAGQQQRATCYDISIPVYATKEGQAVADKHCHNAKIKRYRDQAHKHRLELMIPPELKDRFSSLHGLEDATHAQRLAALCDHWEQHYSPISTPATLLPESQVQEPAAAGEPDQAKQVPDDSPALPAIEPAPPIDADFLDSALQQLDEFDAQLLADQAADLAGAAPEQEATPAAAHSFWVDELLPKVPPCPEKGYYQGLMAALQRLYEREWPRRKHGNTEEAKRWKEALRSDPALFQAFRHMTFQKDQLAELIRHYCLGISPNDILAWAQLDEKDRSAVLWYLVHAGTIYPKALGEVGQRFKQALEHQPHRNPITWQLERNPPL